MQSRSQTNATLRWIAILPTALIAALVAYFVIKTANFIFSGMQGVDTGSYLFRAAVDLMSSTAMGAGFVYAGTWVSPDHKKPVAYVLAAIGLVLAGTLLFPALWLSNYLATGSVIALVFGIVVVTYQIHTNEINF